MDQDNKQLIVSTYSKIPLAQAEAFLRAYGIKLEKIEPLVGGQANSSFLVNDFWVLSILNNHTMASAVELNKTISHIGKNGLCTPQIIPDNSGNYVRKYSDQPVIVRPYVPSTSVMLEPALLASRLGELLYRIHCIPVPQHLTLYGRRLPKEAIERISAYDDAVELSEALDSVYTDKIQTLLRRRKIVMCHGDLMLDNIVHTEKFGLVPIDWETATIDNPLLDIGIAALSGVNNGWDIGDFLYEIIKGYNACRKNNIVSQDEAVGITYYCSVLYAYYRFVRHVIKFPHPQKKESYRDMLKVAWALKSSAVGA